jgi:RNA polymerase-binding transcription factor DksA
MKQKDKLLCPFCGAEVDKDRLKNLSLGRICKTCKDISKAKKDLSGVDNSKK